MTPRRFCLIGLLVLIALVYAQVLGHEFVDYDDPGYVTRNPSVQAGLTRGGVWWAFTTATTGNWHPLTWISLMLDAQIHGDWAGGFHLTNLLLHLAATYLLFQSVATMTGDWRPALVVAGLFGLHPLHVQSVCWISERKGVLSTFFGLAALYAYASYVRQSSGRWTYFACLGLWCASILSKPMLVTFPALLLLLDYWPLARYGASATTSASLSPDCDKTIDPPRRRASSWFLSEISATVRFRWVLDKVPFILVGGVFAIIAYVMQLRAGALLSLEVIPLRVRIGNAVVAAGVYLGKCVWPTQLSFFYPHPEKLPPLVLWLPIAGGLLFATVTVTIGRRRWPWWFVGWWWYLFALAPVVGLIQVSSHAWADRYSDIPLIGIYLAVAFSIPSGCFQRSGFPIALTALFLALAWRSGQEAQYWANSRTLCDRALAIAPDNYLAHTLLGQYWAEKQAYSEALARFRDAVRHKDTFADAHHGLGLELSRIGHVEDAERHFRRAIQIHPQRAESHNNLGVLLADRGRWSEAQSQFETALEIRPDYAAARANLGRVYAASGRDEEAESALRQALPQLPEQQWVRESLRGTQHSRAVGYLREKHLDKASAYLKRLVAEDPTFVEAQLLLGEVHVLRGDNQSAQAVFRSLLRESSKPAAPLRMARLAQSVGRDRDAIDWYRRAFETDRSAEAAKNLAYLLATTADPKLRHGGQAVEYAHRAIESGGPSAASLDTLAIAYAASGDWAMARTAIDAAIEQGKANDDAALLAELLRHRQSIREFRRVTAEAGSSEGFPSDTNPANVIP